MRQLTRAEMGQLIGGEPITLGTIVIIGTATILTVAAFKLFQSVKGKISLPGGFNIEWQK